MGSQQPIKIEDIFRKFKQSFFGLSNSWETFSEVFNSANLDLLQKTYSSMMTGDIEKYANVGSILSEYRKLIHAHNAEKRRDQPEIVFHYLKDEAIELEKSLDNERVKSLMGLSLYEGIYPNFRKVQYMVKGQINVEDFIQACLLKYKRIPYDIGYYYNTPTTIKEYDNQGKYKGSVFTHKLTKKKVNDDSKFYTVGNADI